MAEIRSSDPTITITYPDRRDFLKKLGLMFGGLTFVSVASSFLESCGGSNPTGPKAGNTAASITVDVSSLKADGNALVTSDVGPDGYNIVVYRKSTGNYEAHSMGCTHSGCQVDNPVGSTMSCQCHGSQFDLEGHVLRGPASSPLLAFPTTFDASTSNLTINFK